MIRTIKGNVLDHPTGLIVHGCNCQGIMGGGVAAQIAHRWPHVEQAYIKEKVEMGLFLGTIIPVEVEPFKIIVNAMTQEEGGNFHPVRSYAVDYSAVADCFERVVDLHSQIMHNTSGRNLPIVFPQIGAGIAGGNWVIVRTIIDEIVPDSIEKIEYIYAP